MPGKKTSVLFVNTGKKEIKPVRIPTSLLRNWKKFIFTFTILLISLVGLIAWMVYSNTYDYYKNKLAAADKKFQNLARAVDIEKLKKSFQSIDSGMFRINNFLQEKGLSDGRLPNAGGMEEALAVTDLNGIANFYENFVNEAEEKIRFTPLGVPHPGKETSDFGYRYNPFSGTSVEAHPGIDFKGNTGDPIKATADGMIKFAGYRGGYGNCVIIAHANEFETLFGHLSRILAKEGQKIKAGDVIGLLGSTGRSTGPHVHYEVMKNGKRMDPETFLKL